MSFVSPLLVHYVPILQGLSLISVAGSLPIPCPLPLYRLARIDPEARGLMVLLMILKKGDVLMMVANCLVPCHSRLQLVTRTSSLSRSFRIFHASQTPFWAKIVPRLLFRVGNPSSISDRLTSMTTRRQTPGSRLLQKNPEMKVKMRRLER